MVIQKLLYHSLFILLLFCVLNPHSSLVHGQTFNLMKDLAGGGVCDDAVPTTALLTDPTSMLFINDTILIVDKSNNRIRQMANNIITTFAGGGSYSGDGKHAKLTAFSAPIDLVMNSMGEIIFTESGSGAHKIRKILTNGNIVTVAGTGSTSNNGDKLDARQANLNTPLGIDIDHNDIIYFVDSLHASIRKILTNGTIVTLANNLGNPRGVALHPISGEIYFTTGNYIKKITSSGTVQIIAGNGVASFYGEGIQASSAKVSNPKSLTINSIGEIYFADTGNSRLRKIAANGIITTIAGTGSFLNPPIEGELATNVDISNPYAIKIHPITQEVYFTDESRVYKISNNGTLYFVAGTGSRSLCLGNGDPLSIYVYTATGITSDSQGTVYFCDSLNVRIDKIQNNKISFVEETTTLPSTSVPYDVVVTTDGHLIYTDKTAHLVNKIWMNGTITTIAGTGGFTYNGDGIDATTAAVVSPQYLTIDSYGQIYVSESNRIRKIFTNGTITTIAGNGRSTPFIDNTLATSSTIDGTTGVAVNSLGEIYIADSNRNRIRKVLTNGTMITVAGTGTAGSIDHIDATKARLDHPLGIALSRNGDLYISDSNRIRKLLTNGTIITVAGTGTAGYNGDNLPPLSAQLNTPNGVAVKSTGEVIIVDNSNFKIRLLTFTCYNLTAGDSNVCNGNGNCLDIDQCECTHGWTGLQCSIPPSSCFGISSNISQVCNGNGKCTGIDTCECETGWIGLNCSTLNETSFSEDNSTTYNNTSSPSTNSSSVENSTIANDTKIFDNSTITNITTVNGNFTNTQILDNSTSIDNSTIANNTILNSNFTNCDNLNNCSQHGYCISDNTCECDIGWNGKDCNSTNLNQTLQSNITNNNFKQENNSMISNGTETFNSTLNSNMTNSTNVNSTDPFNNNTNIGNITTGNSTSVNSSSIETNLTSINNGTIEISNSSLVNNTIENNVTVSVNTTILRNSSDITNSSQLFKCFGVEANSSAVCNSNGKCLSTDYCECYSNSVKGYFTSQNCSKCQTDYYGKSCLSKFVGPLKLSNEANGVEIAITAPFWYQSNVSCSDLILTSDLNLFGISPKCYWKEKQTNLFFIEFGSDFQLQIGDSIRFNTLIFEPIVSESNYVEFQVEPPTNPIKPVAIISTRQTSYSTCEDITIDASNSYLVGNRKQLLFIWTIVQSPNSIPIPVSTNNSKLFISDKESPLEGVYIIRLQVENTFTKSKSESVDFKFIKANTAVPTLIIDSSTNQINVKTSNVPIIIEKKVSFASCYSNISIDRVKVEWKLVEGNQLDYSVNSNSDLVIRNFPIKGSNKYSFNVTAIFESQSVYTDVVILTTSENLFSNLYIESLTNEKVNLQIESQDIEQSTETETWTISCTVGSQLASCGSNVDNKLLNYAQNKQTSIELYSVEFNSIENRTFSIVLTIIKGQRTVSSSAQLQFASETSKPLPPLISLLNVSPNRKKLTLNENLNLQLSVSNSDGTDLTNIERIWTLNDKTIPASYVKKMSTSLSTSNSIILDLLYLEQGSTNLLKLKVTNLETQLSNSYAYTFTIAASPPSCPCLVSPSTGYALETDYTFSCSNCQNQENSLTFSLSFVDDKSGANIPLVINGGNTFSTKLPYPLSNPLIFNMEIVDSDTGASVRNSQQIPVLLPLASSVKEVKAKVTKWNTFQNSLQQNDLRRMIFNSAIISRTSEAMISALSNRRSIVKCFNEGVYDSDRKKCACKSGYTKKDCSLTIEDFTLVKEFKKNLFNNFYYAFEKKQEQLSEMYLIYQLYGLDSLLSNVDEIDEETFLKSIEMLNSLVNSANENDNLRVSSGVDKLFSNIFNSFYNYVIYNGCEHCLKDVILQFSPILKTISQFLLKSRLIGESDLKLEVQFISILTNRNYKYYFTNLKTIFDSNNITLTNMQTSQVSNRQLLTFIATTNPNYLPELPTRLISQSVQIYQNRNITSSVFRKDSIISNIISFDFTKQLLLNQSLTFTFERDELAQKKSYTNPNHIEYSCILIQNYTNLLSNNNECHLTMDNQQFYCTCSNSNNTQLAILKSEFESLETTEIIPIINNSNNLLYLLFLVLVISVILVIVIIVVVVVIMVRRKKKGLVDPKRELELLGA